MALSQIVRPISKHSKILDYKKLTKDVFELTFEKEDGVSYLPGQFVSIKIDDGGKSCSRAYSLMNDNYGNLQIAVKIVPTGRGSIYLSKKKKGEFLDIMYPFGRFGLPENLSNKLFFISTGTGIAPILSMLENLPNGKGKDVTVLFGVRTEEDIFYTERIKKLENGFNSFSFIITLSRPSESWKGSRGRVTSYLDSIDSNTQFFICGNGDMISEVKTVLLEKQVLKENIFYESFN